MLPVNSVLNNVTGLVFANIPYSSMHSREMEQRNKAQFEYGRVLFYGALHSRIFGCKSNRRKTSII